MANNMQLAVLFTLLGCVSAGDCAAHHKFKADLTDLKCAAAATNAAGCPDCCTADDTKCGGLANACPDNTKYPLADTAGTTGAADSTQCCGTKAQCGEDEGQTATYTCPAGMKYKADSKDEYCPTDKASCAGIFSLSATTCCEPDASKCGGIILTGDGTPVNNACAAATKYPLGNIIGVTAEDDTWRGKTGTQDSDECCGTKATCGEDEGQASTYTCPAGMKYKTGSTDAPCPGNKASCAGTWATAATTCCTPDTTKCGGHTAPCPTTATKYPLGTHADATWAGKAGAADSADCCGTKALCTAFQAATTTTTAAGDASKAPQSQPVFAGLVFLFVAAIGSV